MLGIGEDDDLVSLTQSRAFVHAYQVTITNHRTHPHLDGKIGDRAADDQSAWDNDEPVHPFGFVAQPHADRNLLFGILALQLDFLSRDQLVAGMQAWVLDKHKPLGQILVEQQGLAGPNREALEVLATKLEVTP